VLDGEWCPLKHEMDNHHQGELDEAERILKDMYKRASEEDFPEVERQRTKATRIRNDLVAMLVKYLPHNQIQYIQAPFEAEWQLCYLLKHGCAESIFIDVVDVFALGAKSWITQLNHQTGDCTIINSDTIQKNEALGQARWKDHLGTFAIFSHKSLDVH
jgi:exonuclease-1